MVRSNQKDYAPYRKGSHQPRFNLWNLLQSFKKRNMSEKTTVDKDAILIVKQPDGNYKGWMWKNGKELEVREGDPNTVLNRLLTHE